MLQLRCLSASDCAQHHVGSGEDEYGACATSPKVPDGRDGGAGPRCSAALAEDALARRSLLGQRGVQGGLLWREVLLVLVLRKLGEVGVPGGDLAVSLQAPTKHQDSSSYEHLRPSRGHKLRLVALGRELGKNLVARKKDTDGSRSPLQSYCGGCTTLASRRDGQQRRRQVGRSRAQGAHRDERRPTRAPAF